MATLSAYSKHTDGSVDVQRRALSKDFFIICHGPGSSESVLYLSKKELEQVVQKGTEILKIDQNLAP